MSPLQPPTRLSRRRLLAASGATIAAGSTAVLAACGAAEEEDQRSPVRDVELLNQVLAGQLALRDMVRSLPAGSGPLALAVDELIGAVHGDIEGLQDAIGDLDGTPTDVPATRSDHYESGIEGLRDRLDRAVADAVAAVADLSTPELVQTVYGIAFGDAAYATLMRDTLGEDQASDAFVGVAAEAGS